MKTPDFVFKIQRWIIGFETKIHGRPYPYVWSIYFLIGGLGIESQGRKYGIWKGHVGWRHVDYSDHYRNVAV